MMETEEISFPRGGRRSRNQGNDDDEHQHHQQQHEETTAKKRHGKRKPSDEKKTSIKQDFLFGSSSEQQQRKNRGRNSTKRQKTSSSFQHSSLLPLGGGGVVLSSSNKADSGAPTIEAFGFSKLSKGTKVLAKVREVRDEFAIVSLPNLLTGYMLASSSSSSCKAMVSVGQTLAVTVQKVVVEQAEGGQQRRRIQVSALPQSVNPRTDDAIFSKLPTVRGQIRSVEDHGCLVDLGLGRQGFVSFENIEARRPRSSTTTTENYTILEAGEDANENEDDGYFVLQPGRLYDFQVVLSSESSGLGGGDAKNPILPLKLPTPLRISTQLVTPPVIGGASGGAWTLNSIMPGWLVTAKLEALAKNGLCVTFLNSVFRGAIESGPHLGGLFIDGGDKNKKGNGDHWKSLFSNHQLFTARVIAVDVPTKLIRLSLHPQLLDYTAATTSESNHQVEIGTIIEDCTVVRNDPGIGALLALPPSYNHEEGSIRSKRLVKSSTLFQNEDFQNASCVQGVYVHISKAMENTTSGGKTNKKRDNNATTAQFGKDFALNTKHTVRILSCNNWMDGIYSGASAPSIIEAHVLTHSDLQPGKVYHQVPICGQLQSMSSNNTTPSVLVQLGSVAPSNGSSATATSIRGLIPPMHLMDSSTTSSDYRRKLLKAKYAVGAKLDVRVLWVDPIKKKCMVTAKKSMVSGASDSDMITNYEDVKLGDVAVGYVSKLSTEGLFVTFCNRVYGKVTARSLASELGIDPSNIEDQYHVGDVVTCRVIKKTKRVKGKKQSSYIEEVEHDDSEIEEEGEEGTNRQPRTFYELTLSLKLQDDDDNDLKEDQVPIDVLNPKQIHVRAGAIIPLKSMKIVELVKGRSKAKGGFVPGYAIVRIKSKYLLSEEDNDNRSLPYIDCKLPYDQLLDEFRPEDIQSPETLDRLAERVLTIGKKINQKGVILTDPHKSNVDYSTGIGRLTVVSIRKKLIRTAEQQYAVAEEDRKEDDVFLPSPDTDMFVGAHVLGYVAQVDPRHGAFVRFLDGMTGLIPKKSGGLSLPLYETVVTRIRSIDDSKRPVRILLAKVEVSESQQNLPFQPGDRIPEVTITNIDFFNATANIPSSSSETIRGMLHCTMKESREKTVQARKKKTHIKENKEQRITKSHPFYDLKVGQTLSNLVVVSVKRHRGSICVSLSDRVAEDSINEAVVAPAFVEQRSQLKPGMVTSGIVTGVAANNRGVYVQVSPFVKGFVPGLELSSDLSILNDIAALGLVGARIKCCVMDEKRWHDVRSRCPFASQHKQSLEDRKSEQAENPQLSLSVIACSEEGKVNPMIPKPTRGDIVIGRIARTMRSTLPPSLMLALRGGYVARCCITEIEEVDEWANMPLGRMEDPSGTRKDTEAKKDGNDDSMDVDEEESDDDSEADNEEVEMDDHFPNGKYVVCRVLKSIPKQSVVDVSLRSSREEGDLDEDEAPREGDTVQGYVIRTNKKGCFVRLARHIEARVTLKELCDGFLPNPEASFPMGRLVVGKVKEVRDAPKKSKGSKDPVKIQVDLDMRESTLLDSEKKLSFDDVELQDKYKGTVTRVESYGVFVQLENSKLSGLVHMSECSDNFIKNLQAMYDPGDLVKILVIKKDDEARKLGFSMKASHFQDDEDSDDDSSMGDSSDDDDEINMDVDKDDMSEDLDSDDENFASKLAAKMQKGKDNDENSSSGSEDDDEDQNSADDSDDESDSDSDSDSESESDTKAKRQSPLDTDVGFEWGTGGQQAKTVSDDEDSSDDSDTDGDDEEEDNEGKSSSHKSRKKQAQRRQEEREISRRETALADGTADENPETAGDFERLLAGDPNSSELWIRYMAFHLSLADISSARAVADKALARIDFSQEREKLNVWTALLTLEHKYGNEKTLQGTIDRACGQNNPKQVYLRACEILEKDLSSEEAITTANNMFTKMCKKFRSKKKVWLAHLQYLLKQSRHQEAHALLKRALLSLAPYKHAETMSKFAQLEFEFGSAERARTVFDGLVLKYPKRLDLFFVYLDKEVKHGSVKAARALLEQKVGERKLSDKQMKSLFKKWYRMEEQHGDEDTMEHVKDSARNFVEQSSK